MTALAEDVCNFVNACPTQMHFCESARQSLSTAGYTELRESEDWDTIPDNFFVIRDERAIIAVSKADTSSAVIIGTNIDSPCLRGKPNTRLAKCGCEQVRIAPYGRKNSWEWMDRCLKAAGRVYYKDGDSIKTALFKTDRAVAIVPSLAVHLARGSATEMEINPEIHLMPIIGLTPSEPMPESHQSIVLMQVIAQCIGVKLDDIIDFDVSFYDNTEAKITGIGKDLIVGARLSNIALAHVALEKFLAAEKPQTGMRVFVAYDAQLIGGNLRTGVRSNFMESVMNRLGCGPAFWAKSWFVGLQNMDALDNNGGAKGLVLGGGVAKKGDVGVFTKTPVQLALEKLEVKLQECSDELGSTLAYIANLTKSLTTVSIGLPTLGRDTVREMIAIRDLEALAVAIAGLLAQ